MAVISASVRTPACVPIDTSDSASCRASLDRLHERAAARLHVQHQRVDALGDLLAHDRRRDQRDALDRAGHVAQRVELLVRGRDLGGLADEAAADLREHRAGTRRATGRCGSPGSIRACRACRRCGRARGPTSSARPRRTRRRAARGSATSCRRRRRCCACRPSRRECATRSTRTPDRTIASVSERGLLRRHAPQHDGHQQGRRLIVGQRPVGHAARRSIDLRRARVPRLPAFGR